MKFRPSSRAPARCNASGKYILYPDADKMRQDDDHYGNRKMLRHNWKYGDFLRPRQIVAQQHDDDEYPADGNEDGNAERQEYQRKRERQRDQQLRQEGRDSR